MAGEATSESTGERDAVEELRAVREILRGQAPPPTLDEEAVVARVRAAISREVTAYHREILEGISEMRGSLRRLEERIDRLEGEHRGIAERNVDLERQRELIHRLIDQQRGRETGR